VKKKRRFKPPQFSTVVGKETVIRGDVLFGGGLHLDGRIEGNVLCNDEDHQATLTVSEEGYIRGDVRVSNVMLNGTVHGDVFAAERVELAEQARVTGKVHYRLLEMAMGAEVNGELVRIEEPKPETTDETFVTGPLPEANLD
jgi:cytoskeletal protein CcmA (bactofilin family)